MAPTLVGTSSSPRCVPFVGHRGEQLRGTRARAPAAAGQGSGRPLGRAAGFFGSGIACVFFTSLERCACVEVRTNDDDLLKQAEAVSTPMLDAGGDGAPAETKSARGGKKTIAAGGKGKRGGFGCWENNIN